MSAVEQGTRVREFFTCSDSSDVVTQNGTRVSDLANIGLFTKAVYSLCPVFGTLGALGHISAIDNVDKEIEKVVSGTNERKELRNKLIRARATVNFALQINLYAMAFFASIFVGYPMLMQAAISFSIQRVIGLLTFNALSLITGAVVGGSAQADIEKAAREEGFIEGYKEGFKQGQVRDVADDGSDASVLNDDDGESVASAGKDEVSQPESYASVVRHSLA